MAQTKQQTYIVIVQFNIVVVFFKRIASKRRVLNDLHDLFVTKRKKNDLKQKK